MSEDPNHKGWSLGSSFLFCFLLKPLVLVGVLNTSSLSVTWMFWGGLTVLNMSFLSVKLLRYVVLGWI